MLTRVVPLLFWIVMVAFYIGCAYFVFSHLAAIEPYTISF